MKKNIKNEKNVEKCNSEWDNTSKYTNSYNNIYIYLFLKYLIENGNKINIL